MKFKQIIAFILALSILFTDGGTTVAYAQQLKQNAPAEDKSTLRTEGEAVTGLPRPLGRTGIKSLMPDFSNVASTDISASKFSHATVRKLEKENYSPNEEISVTIQNGANKEFTTELISANGVPVAVETDETIIGDTKTVTLSQPNSFRPGMYTIRVTDNYGGVSEQDFSWGVLAINPDKSIYAPGETANLAIAVLNELGEMVCDAQVELQIKNPNNETESLSTDNGKIRVNKECESHDFTLKPDYEANYKTGGEGTYEMTLKSQTKNGSYTITDSFRVQKSVAFDVKRVSATRIYPPHTYPVTMEIIANQDFNGTVTETLPASFKVSRPGQPVKTDQDEVDEEIASLSDCSIAPSPNNETMKPCNNENKQSASPSVTPTPSPVIARSEERTTKQSPSGTENVTQSESSSGLPRSSVARNDEVKAPDNLPSTKPIGYSTVNNLSEPVNGKAVLGASIPNLGMPFSGNFPVSQEFGDSLVKDMHDRDLYAQFGMHGHDGMDFAMPEGTPILAVDDGKIVRAGDGDYGKTVVIQHAWGRSYYGHLSEVGIKEGEQVSRGAAIGKSGNTGISTGPHLHFGIRPDEDNTENGYYGKVDPAYYLGLKLSAGQVLGAASNLNFAAADNNETIEQSNILNNVNSDVQILTWKVNVKKGDKITIGYNYLAPRLSPQFYNLGPAVFTDTSGNKIFQEQRKWQIAADAMDLKFKRGSFTKSTCTATCTQTVAGVGFKPKAVILEWTLQTTQASASNQFFGMGIATASTSAGLMTEKAVSYWAEDAQATSDTGKYRTESKSIVMQSANGTIDAEADFASLDNDGFTLSWTTNNASPYIIHYTAIGGADISNVKAGTYTITTTGGATQSFTDLGFRPDFLMTLGSFTQANDSNNAHAKFNVGYASGANDEAAVAISSQDAQATMNANSYQRTGAFVLSLTNAGAQHTLADVASFDANGFTLNVSDVSADLPQFYLAIQGGQYNVGSFTESQSVGTQSVNTGFKPSGVSFAGFDDIAQSSPTTYGPIMLGGASQESSAAWCNDTTGVTCTAEGTTIQPTSTDWCNDNSGVTCTSSWTKRKKITFNNGASSENLTDFPVLVKLNANRIDYNKTKNAGEDIRFVDPTDPSTVLPHEIESWNESGDSYVWVKVPQLDANSTTDSIWMYYGNSGASDGQAAASVWDSNFRNVYHLKGTSGSSTIPDSATGNSTENGTKQDGTGVGSPGNYTNGKIGEAQDFIQPDYVEVSNIAGSPTTLTLEAWIDSDTLDSNGSVIASLGNYVSIFLESGVVAADYWIGSGFNITSDSRDIVGTGWRHIAYTFDDAANQQALYLDGELIASDTHSQSITYSGQGTNTQIGRHGNGDTSYDFDGRIDETRISTTDRSADWIEATYATTSDNMNSFGSEITYSTSTRTTSGWTARRKISLNNSSSTEDLNDFPLMVKLSSASGNIDFDKTKFNGEDIRFVDPSDPNTVLSHEIESWNEPGGEAIVWVKVPKIDAGTTADHIWMYYGNPDAPDGQDRTSVWDSNYSMVHHLAESGSPYQDATSNNNDGSESSNAPNSTTSGKINGAQDFVAANSDRYSVPGTNLPTGDFTYTAWVRPDAMTIETVFDISAGSTADEFTLILDSTVDVYTNGSLNLFSNTTLSAGNMYHIAARRTGSTINVYINGAQDANTGTDSTALSFSTCSLYVGTNPSASCSSPTFSNFYDGIIDEARISNISRSAEWIEAEYISGNNTMNIFGSEETQSAGSQTFSEGAIWSEDQDNLADSEANMYTTTSKAIVFRTGTNLDSEADMQSFDPSGFTVNWTTVNATDRQIIYWAAGSTTVSQDDFRWYKNTDGITPTTALEDENRSTTIPRNKPYARLRTNISAGGNGMNASSSAFKLQYAGAGAEKSVGGTNDWCNDTIGVTCTAPTQEDTQTLTARSDWCNDTSGITCTSSWEARRKITFDNSASTTQNLTDFPVLVKLDSSRIDYSKTQSDGDDLRFVDPSDPTTVLPHEIEGTWTNSGTNYVWVKVPQIDQSSTSDYIWMYYGNDSATSGQDATNVWDANYEGIWHMDDDPSGSAPQIQESSSNNRDGTTGGTMTSGDEVSGKIGNGIDFDGSDDVINVGSAADIDNLSAMTLSVWMNARTLGESSFGRLFDKASSTNPDGGWEVNLLGTNTVGFYVGYTGGSGHLDREAANSSISTSAWRLVTITWTGSETATNAKIYIDGQEVSSYKSTINGGLPRDDDSAQSLLIGNFSAGTRTFDGILDEARLSNSVRTADWVEAEYLTMSDGMNTFGLEESYYESGTVNYGWTVRRKITFNNASSSANLTDFPVLVKLDSSRIDYDKVQDNGEDLRFVDPSDNTTVLPHEIESWDEDGSSYVWVKVPQLDATSTSDFIWMYYGNSSASDGQAGTSVWDSNFQGVWHLNEDPGTAGASGIQDATSNNFDGTDGGSMTSADNITGEIGSGIDFDGTDDYIDMGTSGTLYTDLKSARSISAWIKPSAFPTSSDRSITGGGGTVISQFYLDGSDFIYWESAPRSTSYGSSNTISINAGTWNHVSISMDTANDQGRMYLNGNLVKNFTYDAANIPGMQYIGRYDSGGSFQGWLGGLDEVRQSQSVRNADWMRAEYLTGSDRMNIFGEEQPYVTAGASNAGWTDVADVWCSDASGVTCNTSWAYRKRITIDNSSSSTDLTDFPVLVKLDSTRIDYSKTQDDGGDIRFIDPSDPSTVLPHEIESWNENGNSFVWVKVPRLKAKSNYGSIWMYYGNTSVADGQAATSVWDSNFKMVNHLHDDPTGTAPEMQDSTSNNHDGTTAGSLTAADMVTGKVNGALDFDYLESDTVEITDHANLEPTGDMSISFWTKIDQLASTKGSAHRFIYKNHNAAPFYSYQIYQDTGGSQIYVNWQNTTPTDLFIESQSGLSPNIWYHVTFVKSGTTGKIYINGTDNTNTGTSQSLTGTLYNSNDVLSIGGVNGSDFTDGVIDEVRLSGDDRSADWVRAEYLTSIDAMNTFGNEETQTSAVWKFKDNTSVINTAIITSPLLSTSATGNQQTYQESGLTAPNPSTIAVGERREWDFSLDGSLASPRRTYYFRLVNADGTPLTSYTRYAQITIGVPNEKLMRNGKWFNYGAKQPFTF